MYIVLQDLIDLFGEMELIELSNIDNPSADGINFIRVEAAIAYAESEIDSYLSRLFCLPLDRKDVPPVLINKAADIVRWQLDSRLTRSEVRLRYEEAIRWLKLASQGEVNLGLPPQKMPQSYPRIDSGYSDKRVWTEERLRLFR